MKYGAAFSHIYRYIFDDAGYFLSFLCTGLQIYDKMPVGLADSDSLTRGLNLLEAS